MLSLEGENTLPTREGVVASSNGTVAGDSELVEDYLTEPEEVEFDYFKCLMTMNEPVRGLGGKEPFIQDQ